MDNLKQVDGVAGVINSGGQFQVVIGTHVSEVHEEGLPLLGDIDTSVETGDRQKKNFLNLAIEFISTSFSPIIPAMSGVGMIKALLALLVLFHLVSNESQTYYIVNFMADSVFYFLPMVLAGVLLHPNFATLIAAGDPVNLFAMPVRLVSY